MGVSEAFVQQNNFLKNFVMFQPNAPSEQTKSASQLLYFGNEVVQVDGLGR